MVKTWQTHSEEGKTWQDHGKTISKAMGMSQHIERVYITALQAIHDVAAVNHAASILALLSQEPAATAAYNAVTTANEAISLSYRALRAHLWP